MTAARYDVTIDQGATFFAGFVWSLPGVVGESGVSVGDPVDLSGCSARMQIRAGYGKPVLVEVTTETAGEIELGGVNGSIHVTIPAGKTDLLVVRRAKYDLEVVRGGQVVRVLAGSVAVNMNITRDAL